MRSFQPPHTRSSARGNRAGRPRARKPAVPLIARRELRPLDRDVLGVEDGLVERGERVRRLESEARVGAEPGVSALRAEAEGGAVDDHPEGTREVLALCPAVLDGPVAAHPAHEDGADATLEDGVDQVRHDGCNPRPAERDPASVTTARSDSGAAAVAGLFAFLALLVVPVFPHFVSPNEMTRWAAITSLVDRGRLSFDPKLAALLGPRFEDVAERDGLLYPNKAPGAGLAAIPGYLAARPFVGEPGAASMRAAVTAMRWSASTLPVLALVFFFAGAVRVLRGSPVDGGPATFALVFGTPLLAYGLLLFSHALVALGLLGGWALLFPPDGSERPGRDVAAGALLGLAVLADYPAFVPAAILAAAGAWRRPPARAFRIAAGALPPAVVFFGYHALAFGSPLTLPFTYEKFARFRALREHGAYGVGWPSAGNLLRLLLDPSKGLVVLSPVLLAAAARTPEMLRRLGARSGGTLLAVPVSLLLLYSGFPDWHGGFTVGARYVVPALPFLLLPLAELRWGAVATALAGASAAAVALTTLVFPFVPPGFPLPWGSFATPLLAEGLVTPNLLHLVWRPLAIAVPFVIVLAAAAVAFGRRRLVAFVAGALLWTGAGLLLPVVSPLSPQLVVQRGYVEEVYFMRSGALARSIPPDVPVPPGLTARQELEETLPPTPWPF
jgi:hypothetical protein